VIRGLLRRKAALAGLVFLIAEVAAALLAPVLPLQPALSGNIADARQGPSLAHWLGTDQLGRDTLSRLIWGARPTLLDTAEAVAVALILGIVAGVAAGFAGGRTDRTLIAVSDVIMAMPGMVMLLVVLSIFATHMGYAMVALGILLTGPFMRVIRGATLAVRRELYIDAARMAGLPERLIMARHVIPRIRGTILVQGSLLAGMALLLTTGVAYLGFGTQPPNPSWGLMIGDGAQIMGSSPALIVSAGGATALTVIALGLLGDGLRDLDTERWGGTRPRPPKRRRRAAPTAHRHPSMTVDESSTTLLRIEELSVAYGEREVVSRVSCHLRSGETLGVVGESGSGKTAIARAVLGVLNGGTVTGGRIVLDGRDITDIASYAADQRASLRTGYIAQEPHASLDPTWRAGPLIAESVRRHRGVSRAEARRIATGLLEQVHLPDPAGVARKYPHELSGGMAQRVAIARALACQPRLLIADEPTTALDVTVQAAILDLLREIQADTGMGILFITHDWGVVADLCDRAIVLRSGQVAEEGTVTGLYNDARHDYTRELLASNPALLS
jgi:peptide/nickel transport system permease protein